MEQGTINGIEYLKFGSGDKVFVILPGLSLKSVMGAADAIAAAYDCFASDYTVYLFERRSPAPEGYTILDMAEDTAAVMAELGLFSVCLFGASQGGMMAIALAANHPELVGHLVLGSTAAYTTPQLQKAVGDWMELTRLKDYRAVAESVARDIYSPATFDAVGDDLVESNADLTEEEAKQFSIIGNSLFDVELRSYLSKITCPVLVLGCKGDRVMGWEASLEMKETMGWDCYLYGPEYGHGVYDEAPDYKDRMLQFFGV